MSFVYAEKNRITINDNTIHTLAIYSDTKISFDNNASNWSEPTRRALKQYGLIKTLILNQTCCLSFAGNNIYYVYQLLNTLEGKKDFSEEYLPQIRFVCLVMTEEYLRNHFSDVRHYASVVENREEEPELDLSELIRDNAVNLAKCREHGCEFILIDDKYEVDLP